VINTNAPMYKKLLVGYDGSSGARARLAHAVGLAQIMGAEVWALWLRETPPYFTENVSESAAEEVAAQHYLAKLKSEVEQVEREKGVEIHLHSQAGHASEKIIRYAIEGGFDLILLGAHGHSSLAGRLLGHTTDRVSEHAPCNVLIVRPEKQTPSEIERG
jgi:nucleotide-binding universal stress UspA family protein